MFAAFVAGAVLGGKVTVNICSTLPPPDTGVNTQSVSRACDIAIRYMLNDSERKSEELRRAIDGYMETAGALDDALTFTGIGKNGR